MLMMTTNDDVDAYVDVNKQIVEDDAFTQNTPPTLNVLKMMMTTKPQMTKQFRRWKGQQRKCENDEKTRMTKMMSTKRRC